MFKDNVAKQYGFATALKAHCRVAYGMTQKDPELLQLVGTNLYRRTKPSLWVDVLMQTLDEDQPTIALVTDMRFPNELEAVRKRGGLAIKVSRLHADLTPYVAPDRDPSHPSETALDGWSSWDYELVAKSGEMQLLERHAEQTLDAILSKQTARRLL
jgi:hypothetical protein